MKKILNDPARYVDELLEGMVRPALALLDLRAG